MLAQLEAVDVRGGAVLEGKHQLMTGAVERAHAAIVLGPHDQVLELGIDGFASFEHLAHVAPVHADEVDRAIRAVGNQVLERAA